MATAEKVMTEDSLRPIRWTRDEYHRLGELGFFDNRRVELIDGEIFAMSPQSPRHAHAVMKVSERLAALFQGIGHVRTQFPIAPDELSEPEPDVAVVAGVRDDYRLTHPTSALLIVEVSDSSLPKDRKDKASHYASIGIADYWILNLIDRRLEVHRDPVENSSARYGWHYRSIETADAEGQVAPLAAPERYVHVADLLP